MWWCVVVWWLAGWLAGMVAAGKTFGFDYYYYYYYYYLLLGFGKTLVAQTGSAQTASNG